MTSTLRRFLLHPHVGLILRLVVGITFLYASIYKIREPRTFAQGVLDFHLLPGALVVPFAVTLPWIEALVGALLVVGLFRRGSAVVTLLMLAAFMIAITAAIARGINISCGCFHATSEGSRVAWETLGRDVLLVLGTVPLAITRRTTLELAR